MATNSPFRSSSDLVLQVLADLRIISVGEPVDPEDFSAVSNQLDSIFRKLAAIEIVFVADPNNIPGEWFKDLAKIVGGEMAGSFGYVGQEFIDKVNEGLGGQAGVEIGAGAAAKSLKIMQRAKPTYEPLRFVNY